MVLAAEAAAESSDGVAETLMLLITGLVWGMAAEAAAVSVEGGVVSLSISSNG